MNDIEEPLDFEYSKLPERLDGYFKRYSIINMVITDNWPNCDGLSYCGFGVWYDRKTKTYSGQDI